MNTIPIFASSSMAIASMSRSISLSHVLLTASAIAFLGLYFTLSYFNRAVTDDLLFLGNMHEYGWFRSIAIWPANIRWGSYMLFNTFFLGVNDLQHVRPRLVLFHAFVLLTSISAFILLLKTLRVEFDRLLPVIATLMVASLFFITLQYGEVWFWAIGACVYILPMIGSIMLIGLIYYKGTIHLRYLWILFFSALSFGGLESWALISFGAFLCLAVVQRIRSGTWRIGGRLAVVLLTGTVLGIITLLTSSIGHRMSVEKDGMEYFQNAYGYPKYQAVNTLRTLGHPRFLLALLILMLIQAFVQGRSMVLPLKKYLTTALPIFLLMVVVTLAPLFIAYGSVGEVRAWSPISTALWLLLAGGIFLAGWYNDRYFGERSRALCAALVLAGIVIYGSRVVPHARRHASAYDSRTEMYLRTCNEGRAMFITEPLPDPGVLISGDLERDPNGMYNRSLKRLLGVDCEISQMPH